MPTELPAGLLSLLGFLAPIIIQFVTRYVPTKLGRYLVALVLSGITGVVAMWMGGYGWQFDVTFLVYWYTFAQIAFHLVWQPLTQLTGVLKRIATT